MTSRDTCAAHDKSDPLAAYRDRFVVPEGLIYFDGNSLGLMPKEARARVLHAVETEWAQDLITSWNKHNWFSMPQTLGNRIARLIGGGENNVIVGDSISVNVFKLLTAALALRPDRKVILSDNGNFPTDLYVAQGLSNYLADGRSLQLVSPKELIGAIDESTAIVMVTDIDYRTGRRHDMKALIKKAHASGALVLWDLAHSAGAIPVDLLGENCDFAVGCTYKYLNAGPGAPAFSFVHPRLHNKATSAIVGWWGHARPFELSQLYVPADGVLGYQLGTQPILSLVALDATMAIWDTVDMNMVDEKRKSLCSLFVDLVEEHCGSFGLKLAGPRDMNERGSHVSFHCPEGYAVMQAMIAQKVVGDFRAPDMIRFGLSPLYNTHTEVWEAVMILKEILSKRLWDRSEYMVRKAVT